MENCINCYQLLTHLYESCNTSRYCHGGLINFKEHTCKIGGVRPCYNSVIFMPSSKFPKTVFSIQDELNGYFTLCIFKGDFFILDETLGIKLPSYIKNKLIATIIDY